jgi:hypothetical protein
MTLTRRQTLVGAAATVAAAALPAVAVADAVPSGFLPGRSLLSGNRAMAYAAANVGDWYLDQASRDVLELTDSGWEFLFNGSAMDGPDRPAMLTEISRRWRDGRLSS